jgi:MacB-like periplasmic core domain
MVESLAALVRRNPGFDTQNLLAFFVNLPVTSYPKDPDWIRFDKEFSDRLRSLPGVEGVTSNSVVPLTGGGASIRFLIEGRPVETGHENECNIRDVGANYFALMKIPLLAGRLFNDSADTKTELKHVIVNQAWAKQYFHGEDPLGKRIRFTYSPKEPYREIVGVVGSTAEAGLDGADEPSLFLPFAQDANSFIPYLVRTAGNPANAISAVTRLTASRGSAIGFDRTLHHGPDHRPVSVCFSSPLPCLSDWQLRGARPGSCHGWPVRTHLLFRCAPNARTRSSHRARSAALRRNAPRPRRGCPASR